MPSCFAAAIERDLVATEKELLFVWQTSIDTQDQSSYTPTVKKQCLINQYRHKPKDMASIRRDRLVHG